MNFEKHYIQTQKSRLNWSVSVTALLVILSFYTIITKKSAVASSPSTWIGVSCYLIVFIGQLASRLTINPKIAGSTLILYLLFTAYYLIEMSLKYQSIISSIKEASTLNPRFMVIFSYTVAVIFLGALNLLFYKSFRATQNIQMVKNQHQQSPTS